MHRAALFSAVVVLFVLLWSPLLSAQGEQAAESSVDPAAAIAPTLPPKWVEQLEWRCVGPANMGGRITALAVYEKDPCIWWAATASGGLLKTTNNGISFEHQFDHERTVSIGDVAVAQSDPNIVWVGTGESNPRNSVSWGDGVYKSTDGGQTWEKMGLEKSFQIGRIAIHPETPDIVYVGALGRLWGANEERGVFKTSDGGKSWEKVLSIDEKTGIIDLQMQPGCPDTLLAAAYERLRDGFDGNDPAEKWGPGGGLYKTTDGGKSWTRINKGLPSANLGRIGIDFYRKDPSVVVLVLESERIGQEPPNAPYMGVRGEDAEVGAKITEITKDGPAEKSELEVGDIVVAVAGNTVHSYSDFTKEIRKHLAGDEVEIEVSRDRKSILAKVTFDKRPERNRASNNNNRSRRRRRGPFSASLGGQRQNVHEQQGPEGHEYGGIYKSTDGGESWTRINSVNPRPMYFSQARVDPSDENYLYVLGVSLYRSKDGGETFTRDGARRGVHVDHHAMWINPKDGRHMILGNDGGLYITYDRMENWDHLNHMAIGQFYHVAVGPRRNYRIYGGLQDNGSWGGPSRARHASGPINEDWISIGGGDGFVCRVDPEDGDQVYFESQNGGMGRFNLQSGDRGFIRPPRERGTRYRFNWKTPFILSSHNSGIYYTAGNHVFRSLNRGRDLKKISPEITRTGRGSATALAQSPLDAEVLYVGSDDGALWVTQNGGYEWRPILNFAEEKPDAESSEVAQGASDSAQGDSSAGEAAGTAVEASAPGESRGRRQRSGRGGGRMLERLKGMDANGDGKISQDEVPERMSHMFGRFDTNDDGVIDEQELEARSRGSRIRRQEQDPRSGDPPASSEDPASDPPPVNGDAPPPSGDSPAKGDADPQQPPAVPAESAVQ
ncbi:MAG: PDZ domain-containing protein, partial [Planctomycetota bacterium]